MYVAKDVQEGLHASDFGGEVLAAQSRGEVKVVFGWRVGDQDICFLRDSIAPSILRSGVSESEGWVWQGRLWTAVDVQAAVVAGEID